MENPTGNDQLNVAISPVPVNPLTTSCPNFTEISLDAFKDISEALRAFDSPDIKEELEKSGNTLLLNIEIDGVFENLRHSELQKLSKRCRNKSIVVLFASKNLDKFSIYWKSKDIQNFLTFSPYNDTPAVADKDFYDLLSKFLAESLVNGHLGLLSSIVGSAGKGGNVELHLLADDRDYNLLLIVAESGKTEIFKILLKQNIETIMYKSNEEIRAQDLAWDACHHDIVLTLLKSGATYPKSFDINKCSAELREFSAASEELHLAVIASNKSKINEILNNFEDQHPFYNRLNESVAKIALTCKEIDIYELLTTRKVFLGRHEVLHDFWGNFTEFEREMLRKIHFKNSVHMPEKHLTDLTNCSSVSHDDKNVKSNLNLAQYAFGILNQNPFIRIILMIVAASKKLKILFDFKSNSVDVVDPTADSGMRGLFYTKGIICVAAGFLINQSTENETFGTLAHELCHYAMNLVYRNSAKPYRRKDRERRQEFAAIAKLCEQNREKEMLIDLALKYPQHMHHAELIVRVPHLMALYHNQPKKLKEARNNFDELFAYFEQKVVPDMEKKLPRIEKEIERMEQKILRNKIISIITIVSSIIIIIAGIFVTRSIFYKPVYTFNELSREDQVKVENASVNYKNVQIQFQDLFPRNSSIYQNLTSDHISQMLNGHKLDFSDPHVHYLDDQLKHDWENLTEKLKEKVLNSNVSFQNESLKFHELNEKGPHSFKFQTSDQIVNLLDNKELIIDQMIPIKANFYVERRFRDENIFEIFWAFILKVQFNGWMVKSEERFREFYAQFVNQNINKCVQKINEIKGDEYYKIDLEVYFNTYFAHLLSFESFHEDSKEVFQKTEKSKMFILSSEAGTGKTATFEQFTRSLKQNFPSRWVSFIDLKDYTRLYNKNESLGNILSLLEDILGLSYKSEFERKFFEELFESGDVILLWNGFDEISPTYSGFILDLLDLIYRNSKNIQFVSTRPLYSDQLWLKFHIRPYTFVPFDKEKQEEFLRNFFISAKIDSDEIQNYFLKVQKIVNYLTEKGPREANREDFSTPLMLEMIADLVSDKVEFCESENLWELYENFIKRKVDIWNSKGDFASNFLKSSLTDYRNFNLIRMFQMFALRSEMSNLMYEKRLASEKSKVMHQKIPDELTNAEISRMGILYINGPENFKFAHKTFAEFFIAQFLIDSIYFAENVDSDDAVHIIQVFFYITREYKNFQVITKFIISFLQSPKAQRNENFASKISECFKSKFKSFLFNLLRFANVETFEFLLNFFKKDHKLLVDLLHVNDNETLYTAVFNCAYFGFRNINTTAIKDLGRIHLTEEEFKKFIHGKSQKGIILFNLFLSYRNDVRWKRKRTIFHDEYDLDEEILQDTDRLNVLKSIAANLTESELKSIFLSTSSSLIWKESNMIKNESFWRFVESFLNPNELKVLITNLFVVTSKSLPSDSFRSLVNKTEQIFSNAEIFHIFMNQNILQNAAYCLFNDNRQTFEDLWDFFVNHTTNDQQREILLHEAYGEYVNDISVPIKIFHEYPPLNILQISFISQIETDYRLTYSLELYEKYFNTFEIQEIILKSNYFLPFLVQKSDCKFCKQLCDYLERLFKGNGSLLKEFMLRKIEPTNLNIFEFMRNSGQLKPLSDLLKSLD